MVMDIETGVCPPPPQGILTLSVGKKFNRQARYLALSCMLHSPAIPRAIITDDCDAFKELYDVVIAYTKEMGDPFEVKLKLHLLTPFYETLFLDSDTLVYTDLRFMWGFFQNTSLVYAGERRVDGTWYVEVSSLLERYNLPWIGQLNSGIFLFKKDRTGIDTLDYAAYLHKNHDGIDMPYFRGTMFPDEPFLAMAFGRYNQIPVTNDFGRLGRSLIGSQNITLNIAKGIARFIKNGHLIFPAVVHFVGDPGNYYFIEKTRLWFYYHSLGDFCIKLCRSLARGFQKCLRLPGRVASRLKRALRFT